MAALYHCASRHGIITKKLLRRRRRRTPGCVRAEGGERHQRKQKRKTRQAAGLHPGSYRPVLCPRRRPGRCGFDLLFALFPLLVFVSTLVGLMDLDIEETLTAMSRILPEQVLGIVGSYLEYVSTSPSRQLLVFSLIFSVWFPLRATSCLMHSVRKAYGVPQPPSMIGGTLRNLIFTLWLIVTIAASIVLTTVGRRALQFVSGLIHIPDQFINVWETLRFAVLGVIMLLVLVPLNMLARGRRCPLREVVPGVLLSMLAWLALSVAFSYYVEKVAHYTELYGSIATIVVVLLWLYMTGQVLIMGAEYNGSRLAYRENKTIHPPEGEKGTK